MSTIASFDVQWASKHFDFLKGIDLVGRELEVMRKATVVAMNATGSFGNVMNTVAKSVTGLGNQISSASRTMTQFGQAMSRSVTQPLLSLGKTAVQLSGHMEGARFSFTKLLGSAEKSDKFLKEMWKFAAETPFEMKGLQNNAQKLLAFGFEAKQIIPTLTIIGDSLSVFNRFDQESVNRATKALGDMSSAGTILKQDLSQLRELGIPVAKILNEELGLTARQVAKIGDQSIESSVGVAALLRGMERLYGGSMEAQSKSLLGLLSTLKDNVSMVLTELGQDITNTFNFKEKIESGIVFVQEALVWFKALDATTKGLIVTSLAFVAAIGPALTIIGQIGLGVGALVIAFGFFLTPLGLATAAVALFAEEAVRLAVTQDNLRALVVAAWPAIKEAVETAASGMQHVLSAATAAMEGDWKLFHEHMGFAAFELGAALDQVWTVAVSTLTPILEAALASTVDLLQKAIDRMIGMATGLAAKLPGIIMGGLGDLGKFAGEVLFGDPDVIGHGALREHAAGALVKGPRVALIGEGAYSTPWGRGAEAVVPLHGDPHRNLSGLIGMAGGGVVSGGGSEAMWQMMSRIAAEDEARRDSSLQSYARELWMENQRAVAAGLANALPDWIKALAFGAGQALTKATAAHEGFGRAAKNIAEAGMAVIPNRGMDEEGYADLAKDIAEADVYLERWIDELNYSAEGLDGMRVSAEYADVGLKDVMTNMDATMEDWQEATAAHHQGLGELEGKVFSVETAFTTMEEACAALIGSFHIAPEAIDSLFTHAKGASSAFAQMQASILDLSNNLSGANLISGLKNMRSLQESGLKFLTVMDNMAAGVSPAQAMFDSLVGSMAPVPASFGMVGALTDSMIVPLSQLGAAAAMSAATLAAFAIGSQSSGGAAVLSQLEEQMRAGAVSGGGLSQLEQAMRWSGAGGLASEQAGWMGGSTGSILDDMGRPSADPRWAALAAQQAGPQMYPGAMGAGQGGNFNFYLDSKPIVARVEQAAVSRNRNSLGGWGR